VVGGRSSGKRLGGRPSSRLGGKKTPLSGSSLIRWAGRPSRHAGRVGYLGQEATFTAAVVAVEPGDGSEVVQVQAVAPGGQEVRFEAFTGEHEVGVVVEVTVRRA
jgi:hypothetical protein